MGAIMSVIGTIVVTMYNNDTFTGQIPGHAFLIAVVCLIAYNTLDWLDGK